ncbi:hypothetical protein EUA03_11490 [Mycolicibacterium mucogenicum]|uniref:50S ribosomal protein L31 n=1 Tax=Mycolicibacterium mucogenicum TaxID=56689 RepID=A0A4R5WI88_MYCMU|nr:hypothetical protein EUA03_11490 [Mycolicibacterium mucogenicum]
MEAGIHPGHHHPVAFRDATPGRTFLTRSTATSSRTVHEFRVQ